MNFFPQFSILYCHNSVTGSLWQHSGRIQTMLLSRQGCLLEAGRQGS